MLTPIQWERLLATLALSPHETLLDLGCGCGQIAATLAEQSGAQVIAIDREPELFKAARTRFGHQVDYREADFNNLPADLPPCDAVLALDTLYFCDDLPRLMARSRDLLKPGGRLVTFWTQTIGPDGDRRRLEPLQTDFARALSPLGFELTWETFTDEERGFWERGETALVELEAAFRSEGLDELYAQLEKEIPIMRGFFDDARAERYLYRAKLPD